MGMSNGGTVAGTVTWEGKPLALGNISLIPAGNGDLPPVKALITNGRYSFPDPPGVAAGSYKVRIASKRDPRTSGPVGEPRKGIPEVNPVDPRAPELVPAKYNDETTLTAEIGPGTNTKDFELAGIRPASRTRVGSPRR